MLVRGVPFSVEKAQSWMSSPSSSSPEAITSSPRRRTSSPSPAAGRRARAPSAIAARNASRSLLGQLPQELAEVLRVEQLANRGRVREVGEEYGDDTPLLPLVGSARGAASVLAQAAGGTEGRGRRLLGPAAGAGW
jgi:hypothetical protein